MSAIRTFAAANFTVANDAPPLISDYQAARLAVTAEVTRRVGGDKVTVSHPAPGPLILTAYQEEMAAILAEESAQALAPLLLDVATADEAFSEYLRDRA